jgi:hypothetical protein
LVSQLLRFSWLHDEAHLEVIKPEIDRTGHDIVFEAHGVIRHAQLKTSSLTAKTARQKIHLDLASKPSGCVIWTRFDSETLELGPFLFFGGAVGEPLPSLDHMPVAKHTKGDATGNKAERPNIRVLSKGRFEEFATISDLYHVLFGLPANPGAEEVGHGT